MNHQTIGTNKVRDHFVFYFDCRNAIPFNVSSRHLRGSGL